MKKRGRAKRSRRERKIWITVWAAVMGTLGLGAFAVWADLRRETDLADPKAGVTSEFKGTAGAALPPIRFRDVALEAGIVMRHGPGARGRTLPEDTGSGLAWGDTDGDGDWDLYAVSFPGPLGSPPGRDGSNRLFRNDGGRFTDVTAETGTGDIEGFGMGATFADYDADGDTDLYVTNYGPNRLFRNRGDGTFEEVAGAAGVADPLWSTGAVWGDFDRDGHLDLYVCNYVEYEADAPGPELVLASGDGTYSVPFTLNPNSFDPQPNRLYRNLGDGTFEDVAVACGVDDSRGRSLAATFCDLDGDGWLDLYVNNDVSANKLFRNLGRELSGKIGTGEAPVIFADLSTLTGTADPRGSMGLSVLEIGAMGGNADGLPDLFITHWVAQENAFYQSTRMPSGALEYRDKTRQFRLGEVSLDSVGWGCASLDLDLDGRPDLAVANGSTLERRADPILLKPEPLFLFWNDGERFQDVAPRAGEACARRHDARGLAAADYDGDGDVDLAVAVNRGQPLLLRNDTETQNRALAVRLAGPPAACFGARIEVEAGGTRQVRWYGADASYLSAHAPEAVFGLGCGIAVATRLSVTWADGKESSMADIRAGRVVVEHPAREGVAAKGR